MKWNGMKRIRTDIDLKEQPVFDDACIMIKLYKEF